MDAGFKSLFLQLCKDNHVSPQESILPHLNGSKTRGKHHVSKSSFGKKESSSVLDLSTSSLSAGTCLVLGKALSTDHYITELKLADCNIGDEGMKLLIQGLVSNVSIRRLDLKGNNLRQDSAEYLGRLLRHNHSLLSLCLEWNSLGLDSSAFNNLSEGLAANNSLKELDLRNNQINQESASCLAKALQINSTLKHLDLRWNTVGLVGGRSFVTALQYNKTLTHLNLGGNNTPLDVMKAVDSAISRNTDRAHLSSKHSTRQEVLSKHIQQLKYERKKEVTDLMQRINQQGEQLDRKERDAVHKISRLQEALEERKTAFNALSAQLKMREAELALSEQQVTDLKGLLEKLRQENSDIVKTNNLELQRQKEEKSASESRLVREVSDLKDKTFNLESKNSELEQKCSRLQEQLYETKEELTSCQAEVKVQASQFEEKLQIERQKQREVHREASQKHAHELQRFQSGSHEAEKSYKERINQLEQHRKDLEEELRQLKGQQLAEKLTFEEQLLQTRHKVKEEEQQRYRHLEDRLRTLQSSKDELQQHYSQQCQQISELQARQTNSLVEVESLKRTVEQLTQELAGKTSEKQAAISHVEQQYKRRITDLQGQLHETDLIKDKCTQLQQELTTQNRKHLAEIAAKDSEILTLQDQVRRAELEVVQIRDEESQRAAALQNAITSYISATPRSPMVTPRK